MRKSILSIILLAFGYASISQISTQDDVNGRVGDRIIQVSVPFLTIAPDARAAGMADVGVATTPDVNSAYWNAAKLVFATDEDGQLSDMGGGLSYTPWLRRLVNDMSLSHVSFFKRLRKEEVVGFSMTYFNLGSIEFRDGPGESGITGEGRPREFNFKVDYARQLTNNFSVSAGMKWIHSNLASGQELSNGSVARAGNSIAVDIGTYWNNDVTIAGQQLDLAWGVSISNFGNKITYSTRDEAYFIPTNLKLGTSITKDIDLYNKITLAIDVNKLMVPTPAEYDDDGNVIAGSEASDKGLISGVLGSFADAPGGFSEEMQEFMIGTSVEYWYANAFAARAGYFHESATKGNRKFVTLGAGVRWKTYGIDFAYLLPVRSSTSTSDPLADTIRLSLKANFKSKKKDKPAETAE